MGKRELVLIVAFLMAGVVVYQVTAPPAPAGSDVSVGGILSRIKRNMRGARESGNADSRHTFAVPANVRVLRVNLPRASDLTIVGTDRSDISVEMRTSARGYTAAEAQAAAEAAAVKVEPNGEAIVASGAWDSGRRRSGDPFITQAVITLSIPRRLSVSVQPHIGLLNVTDVAKLEVVSSRGETHIAGTAGDVQVTHVSGALEIKGGTSLRLSARNSKGEVSGISGAIRVEAVGSRLKLSAIAGQLDLDARNTDLSIENSPELKPGLRYNGQGGELRIEGLRTEARIDGRNTDINVKLDAPAPVTIYNVGGIVVTAPPGGYSLDAAATEGRITAEDGNITATPGDGPDARASAKVRGGGPALTLRSTRGRIEIRRAGK